MCRDSYFNLVQLVVLLIALLQTMLLHRLMHAKMHDTVILVDNVFRVFIPFLLYPCIALGMILIGLRYILMGSLFIIGGFIGTGLLAAVQVYRGKVKVEIDRAAAVSAVHSMPTEIEEEEYVQTVTHLFNTFDLDKGGQLDIKEMRFLVNCLYPGAPRAIVCEVSPAYLLSLLCYPPYGFCIVQSNVPTHFQCPPSSLVLPVLL